MIEVKSFKDMDGKKVGIGDKVRYVSLGKESDKVETVRKITKEGYFISVHIVGFTSPWIMPRICVRKVDEQ